MATQSKFPISYSRLSTFEQCPLKFEALYVEKTCKDEGSPASREGQKIHEALAEYGERSRPMPQSLRRFQPTVDKVLAQEGEKLFEYQIALTPDRKETGWFDKNVWLRAVLDVLVLNEDKAVVIDWKTGKRKPDPTQLQMFAAVVMTAFPEIDRVRSAYVWLKDGTIDSSVVGREQLDSLWEGLYSRFDRVQEAVDDGYFEAKPSYLCKWCPARKNCVYAK